MSFSNSHKQWLDSGVAVPEKPLGYSHTDTDPKECPACQHRVPVETPGIYEGLIQVTAALRDLADSQRKLLVALGSSSDSRSSVEITVDSKATVKPTVKVYADSDPAIACEQAQTLFDDLIIKYGPKAA